MADPSLRDKRRREGFENIDRAVRVLAALTQHRKPDPNELRSFAVSRLRRRIFSWHRRGGTAHQIRRRGAGPDALAFVADSRRKLTGPLWGRAARPRN
jgi:hypothetical protein